MKLIRLRLANWGPFENEQEILFESNPAAPVILVHGENMRGKTSIMRAIRWALYGTPQMALESVRPAIEEFANWNVRDAESEFIFGATLEFSHADQSFEISRLVKATRASGNAGRHEYLEEPPLMREVGGNPIAADLVSEKISGILHPDIAGFFFFDGESLDRFEETLKSDEAGNFVRRQIEVTLGVPALLTLRDDVKHLLTLAREEARKLGKSEAAAIKIGIELAEVDDLVESLQVDLEKFEGLVQETRVEIKRLEENLEQVQQIRELLVARRERQSTLETLRSRRRGFDDELKAAMQQHWWLPLAGRLPQLFDQATEERRIASEHLQTGAILEHQLTQMEKQLHEVECMMCGQSFPPTARGRIENRIQETKRDLEGIPKGVDLASIDRRVEGLKGFASASQVLAAVEQLQSSIRRLDLDIEGLVQSLAELSDQIGDPRFNVEESEKSLQTHKVNLERLNVVVAETRKKLESAENQQQQKLKKLAEATPGADRARAEIDVYERLLSYVQESIEHFRNEMRTQVQDAATRIFLDLTTEKEYAGLRIDGNYYLQIVDDADRVVERRSAGASEIVTIALIGALGECSVEEAPIVMDTPFGRLDNAHRANVLRWLSKRSSQSVLFVQSGEFVRDTDLQFLQGRVGREYNLRRLGPTSTQIEVQI
jgi:DNA sulfur modification protein DndD